MKLKKLELLISYFCTSYEEFVDKIIKTVETERGFKVSKPDIMSYLETYFEFDLTENTGLMTVNEMNIVSKIVLEYIIMYSRVETKVRRVNAIDIVENIKGEKHQDNMLEDLNLLFLEFNQISETAEVNIDGLMFSILKAYKDTDFDMDIDDYITSLFKSYVYISKEKIGLIENINDPAEVRENKLMFNYNMFKYLEKSNIKGKSSDNDFSEMLKNIDDLYNKIKEKEIEFKNSK